MTSGHCDKALHCCGSAVPALDPPSPAEPSAALPSGCRQGPSASCQSAHSCRCADAFRRITSDISPLILSTCPLEAGLAFIPEEFPAVVVFPLSSHTHASGTEVGFPSHSSCPLCAHAGKTTGCLVVCPLSLKRGPVAPSSRGSGLYWCDMGHCLSPQPWTRG